MMVGFFTRLHHIESIENARIRRLKEIHLKLACDDTQALEGILSVIKENSPPPELIKRGSHPTSEHDDIDISQVGDLCVPLSLYLYDECSVARIQTNDRLRLYPSDHNIAQLKKSYH